MSFGRFPTPSQPLGPPTASKLPFFVVPWKDCHDGCGPVAAAQAPGVATGGCGDCHAPAARLFAARQASVAQQAAEGLRGYNGWGWNVPGLYILNRHGPHGLSQLLLSSLLNGHFIEKPWTGLGESSAWQQWPCTSGGFGGFGPGPVPKLCLRHALHGKRSFTSRLGCETSAGNTLCHGTKVESQQPNLEFSHLKTSPKLMKVDRIGQDTQLFWDNFGVVSCLPFSCFLFFLQILGPGSCRARLKPWE